MSAPKSHEALIRDLVTALENARPAMEHPESCADGWIVCECRVARQIRLVEFRIREGRAFLAEARKARREAVSQ